jgi:hypothetical protein
VQLAISAFMASAGTLSGATTAVFYISISSFAISFMNICMNFPKLLADKEKALKLKERDQLVLEADIQAFGKNLTSKKKGQIDELESKRNKWSAAGSELYSCEVGMEASSAAVEDGEDGKTGEKNRSLKALGFNKSTFEEPKPGAALGAFKVVDECVRVAADNKDVVCVEKDQHMTNGDTLVSIHTFKKAISGDTFVQDQAHDYPADCCVWLKQAAAAADAASALASSVAPAVAPAAAAAEGASEVTAEAAAAGEKYKEPCLVLTFKKDNWRKALFHNYARKLANIEISYHEVLLDYGYSVEQKQRLRKLTNADKQAELDEILAG